LLPLSITTIFIGLLKSAFDGGLLSPISLSMDPIIEIYRFVVIKYFPDTINMSSFINNTNSIIISINNHTCLNLSKRGANGQFIIALSAKSPSNPILHGLNEFFALGQVGPFTAIVIINQDKYIVQ